MTKRKKEIRNMREKMNGEDEKDAETTVFHIWGMIKKKALCWFSVKVGQGPKVKHD